MGKKTYAYQWRDYDPAIGRFNKIDRFAEKYADVTPYGYITNNPIAFKEIKGDSIRTVFYDKEGKRVNKIPKAVQKMFNDEFGIKVGYNSKTSMLYYGGSVDSKLSQSKTATNTLVDALKDTNTGTEHGTIEFGYNRRLTDGSGNVGNGAYKGGIVQINLANFDSNGDLNKWTYSSVTDHRVHNLARVFEHEYFGHFLPNRGAGADGGRVTMGSAVEITNALRRERGLSERLHYGDGYDNRIYFGNTGDYSSPREQRKAVRKMIKNPGTNNLFIQKKPFKRGYR